MSSNNSMLSLERKGSSSDRQKMVEELKSLYKERRGDIRQRLEEFRHVLDRDEIEVFAELSFCILTPQSAPQPSGNPFLNFQKNILWPKQGQPAEEEIFHRAKSYR